MNTDDSNASIRLRYSQFRILIIGKANAGKTTILEKVCETKDEPIVLDRDGNEIDSSTLEGSTAMRGMHNIEDQIRYSSRPDFVFHDSCGIEAGSIAELETMRAFISRRSSEPVLTKRVHAIWYCLPTDNDRPLTTAEMALFESGTGSVPVIAIFTKFDGLETKAFLQLREEGKSRGEAKKEMTHRAELLLQKDFLDRLKAKDYPPAAHVCLSNMHKADASCDELIRQTLEALNTDALKQLFLSAQQAKVGMSTQYALKRAILQPYVFDVHPAELTQDGIKTFMGRILAWFPHLWFHTLSHRDNLENEYERFNPEHGLTPEEELATVIEALVVPFLSLPGPLNESQIVQLGLAVLIVAACSFNPDNKSPVECLRGALQVYQASSTQDAIRRAVESEMMKIKNMIDMDETCKAGVIDAFLQVIEGNKLATDISV